MRSTGVKVLLAAAALGTGLAAPGAAAAKSPPAQDSVTFTGGPAQVSEPVHGLRDRRDERAERREPGRAGALRRRRRAVPDRWPGDVPRGPRQQRDDQPPRRRRGLRNHHRAGRRQPAGQLRLGADRSSAGGLLAASPDRRQGRPSQGDIAIVDAAPRPSKDQCKGGGWRQLGFRTRDGACGPARDSAGGAARMS